MPHRETPQPLLSSVSEGELLDLIFPVYRAAGHVPGAQFTLLGPGDDTALLRTCDGRTRATTATMVSNSDWDEWSTAEQVGAKCAVQNLADIAAMGGTTRGLLVTLVADPQIPLAWAIGSARGIAREAAEAGAEVLGGDLSAAPEGVVMLSITALGDLAGHAPVTRSGARPGDVIALAGGLGRSGAGLELLYAGRPEADPELVSFHLRPTAPLAAGPQAAAAGATSMIDLSDGLLVDAGRIGRASGVVLEIDSGALASDLARLAGPLGDDGAYRCVLSGGEEHSLLATYRSAADVPDGWRILGRVRARPGDATEPGWATVDGQRPRLRTWDHFTEPGGAAVLPGEGAGQGRRGAGDGERPVRAGA